MSPSASSERKMEGRKVAQHSETARIASDDDSGIGLNPRIRMFLDTGEYFARVRHYSRFGGGPYRISVNSG
jgi:tyrosinase